MSIGLPLVCPSRAADPPKSGLLRIPIAKSGKIGRGERIRTSDSCVPNAVLYQAELHPELPLPRPCDFL